MTESTDQPSDSPTGREVVARADRDGIAVRKVATMHGSEAVAVYFSIRSNRDAGCKVRIADAVPEPLRGREVEFHPKYDPANWRRADGSVVYAATIPPDANRTTVYGVVVDGPDQLGLFSSEPVVEVTPNAGSTGQSGSDDGSFSFGTLEDEADSMTEPAGEEPRSTGSDRRPEGSAADEGVHQMATDSGVFEALISEIRRRELTDLERQALREALGMDGIDDIQTQFARLREEVGTLRDEAVTADRQAADVERIESQVEALSEALDRRYASLTDDLENLETALDREVRWRSRLRDSIEFDPEAER